MKRKYTGKLIVPLLALLLLFSCKGKTETPAPKADHQHHEQTTYTCPMHPQIVQDKPGTCPICGMDLVPMNTSHHVVVDDSLLPLLQPVSEQIISSVATIRPGSGSKIFSVPLQGVVAYDTRSSESVSSRVAGRIERMHVKYNYQPVRKGQLIMEIYSPDLAAAQRELIYIAGNDSDPALLEKAKQRLSLLGMQTAEIHRIIKTGKPLYRIPVYSPVSGYIVEKGFASAVSGAGTAVSGSSAGGMSSGMNGMGGDEAADIPAPPSAPKPAPVVMREGQYLGAGETVFTVYKDDKLVAEFSFPAALAASIKPGQKLLYSPAGDSAGIRRAAIGLIEPTQRSGRSFSVARAYLRNTDLKPGQLLNAYISVVKDSAFWLPEEALLDLGTKTVVFKKENGVLMPKLVKTGIRTNGVVEIRTPIADWMVAKNAGFLVDNESFIRVNSIDTK